MITGQTTEILEAATNEALRAVSRWLDENGLTLSKNKTEAVILTTKRAYEKPRLQIDGIPIEVKEKLRYLGVELSQILGFRKHIEKVSAGAISTASSLTRLMPNIGEATQLKRKLLATVIHSQLLYAAPIWANDLEFKRLVDPKCVDCLFQRDDAEHAIFHCDRLWSLRRALEVDIGLQFEPDTIVDVMLQSKGKWNTIQKFLNKILSKREEERKRQQEEALII
ncbi:hypothetical protein QTP88_018291 [Uroleucon formosanum]